MTQRGLLDVAPTLTAIFFTLGSFEHAIGFVLLLFGIHLVPPPYPAWRHAAFMAIDASIAWVALRRPRTLVFCLLAFLIVQVFANGPWAWHEWVGARRIPWTLVIVDTLVFVAMVAAAVNRRGRRDHEDHEAS